MIIKNILKATILLVLFSWSVTNVQAQASLELHYKFDEVSGTQITDYSGNGRTGIISSEANITLGVQDADLGLVLHKTGSGSVKTEGYEGIAGSQSRTVAFYFKQEESVFCNIFSYGDPDNGYFLLNVTGSGRLRFVNQVGGSYIESNTTISPNEWVHIAWVILPENGDEVKASLYLNGKFEGSTPSSGFVNSLNTILDGDVNAIDNYNGSYFISDLRMYSQALGVNAIRDLLKIKQDQNLTFSLSSEVTEDIGTIELKAIASSGLAPSYSSSNQSVATVSGNILTVVGQGTTEITATQLGDQLFAAAPPVTIELTVHPPTDPGTSFDLQAYIDERIGQGQKVITLPSGRLRVPAGGRNTHLFFENLQDISLIGNNTEIICTETTQAIRFENCTNIKLQGISIDYDPLPFTQAVITSIANNKQTLNVKFLDGYSSTVFNDRVEIYDPETAELSAHTYYGVTVNVNEADRTAAVIKPNTGRGSFSTEEVGDILLLDSRSSRRIPHTILIEGCTNMTLEDITIYSGTSFAYFERNSSGSKYADCKILRRPLLEDLVPREMKRMRSNNADGFHSKHADIGPEYRNCEVGYNGDDGFAVNGNYHIITEVNGNELTVIGKGGDMPNIEIGDMVEMVAYTGARIPDAQVLSITEGRSVNATERAFLNEQVFIKEAADTRNASNVYIFQIDRLVELPLGSLIASANKLGNGAKVIDCKVGPTRSRGILLKSSDVTVTGNTIHDTWGQAIKMSPEYKWLEAGTGNNIIIQNNTISDSHEPAIAVYAFGGNGQMGAVGSHDNVEITDNVITNTLNPAIVVTATSNLLIENNSITSPNLSYFVPWIEDFGRSQNANRTIYLNNTSEKVIQPPLNVEDLGFLIEVFPNPVSNQLIVKSTDSIPKPFAIFDMMQRLVFTSTGGSEETVDTSVWSSGVFVLKTSEGSVKIIKK